MRDGSVTLRAPVCALAMTHRPQRHSFLAVFSLALFGTGALAKAIQDENLLQGLPAGFEVGHQVKRDGLTMVEMVPSGQSVHDWSEMVTTQIFHGSEDGLDDYFGEMRGHWSRACDGMTATPIRDGEEHGYRFALWMFGCPMNPSTGKPETTWMKGVRGNDALYVVQWAFRREPSEGDVRRSVSYLREVVVCDSRIERSACPRVVPEDAAPEGAR